ncbi:hypothetical protein DQ04_12371000 [Trypanosoma grayi]|uniref:hypothetical protein n=1 Tax=Trypanosoma grayi TaxID=71804 RepID=UPI0004F415FA|nr:hypothetical protein DQ04_12371000 [Trypanosoma grayi]KEG06761.1 hypothetical protein DQ04_12371000 [Trypanosoma grayi]
MQRRSHWVSLVGSAQPTTTAATTRHEGKKEQQQRRCGDGNDREKQLLLDVEFAGAKDVFALRLSEEQSEERSASFLRKRKMYVSQGVQVHRWNRVEFFSPNIHTFALAVAQTQPLSIGSSFTSAFNLSFSCARQEPSQICSARSVNNNNNNVSAPVLLTESFSSNASRSLLQSHSPVDVPPHFPESSLYCHCLALPAHRIQELQGAAESRLLSSPLSLFTSTHDVVNVFERHAGSPDAPPLQQPHIGANASHHATLITPAAANPTTDAQKKNNNATPFSVESAPTATMAVSPHQDNLRGQGSGHMGPLSASNHDPASPLGQGSTAQRWPQFSMAEAPYSKTVVASIITSCFDVSIDPFQWREANFNRTTISYSSSKPSIRRRFGEGVVTRVMYGGVCIVMCSNAEAVRELEKALHVAKWSTTKTAKAMTEDVKKVLRGGDSNHNSNSSEPMSPSVCSPSAMYCVLQCVGGMDIDSESESVQQGKTTHSDGLCNCTTRTALTPWVNLRTMTRIARMWALHLVSNPELAEPLAVYVQRFDGILPALHLAVAVDYQLYQIVTDSEDEVDVDGDGDAGITACEPVVSVVGGRRRSFYSRERSPGSWNASLIRLETASTGTNCMPVPMVLYTGRALTQSIEGDWALSTTTQDSYIFNYSAGSDVIVADSVAASEKQVSQYPRTTTTTTTVARPGVAMAKGRANPKLREIISTTKSTKWPGNKVAVRRKQSPGTVPHFARRTVRPTGEEPRTCDPQQQKKQQEQHQLPPPNEDETLWERAMLEVRALDTEFQDVLNSCREAEEELQQCVSTLQNLQRAFLPLSLMNSIEPTCAYLQTMLEEPAELPERCGHFNSPDWLPCLAAVLTNPKNSLHSIEISWVLTIPSLPKLGMLAGLLFHEHAMLSLRRLSIRLDNLCGSAQEDSIDSPKLNKQKPKLGSRLRRKKDLGKERNFPDAHHVMMGGCTNGPPLIVNAFQMKGILLALTDAVVRNVRELHFTLHLKEFPRGDAEEEEEEESPMFHRFLRAVGNHKSSRRVTQPPDKIKESLNKKDSVSWSDLPAHAAGESGGFDDDYGDEIEQAWHDAECRPYSILLRHRELQSPYRPTSYWNSSHYDLAEQPSNSPTVGTAPWVYGLRSHHVETALLCRAQAQIWAKAAPIFDALQSSIMLPGQSSEGSCGSNQACEGSRVNRSEIVLLR